MNHASLLVQEYLKSHTFGELEAEHGVNVSVARARPYKFSINYDQIESKPSPLVNQCRGLILRSLSNTKLAVDEKVLLAATCPGDTQVLARPFDRFFNLGDSNCAEVAWSDPKLQVQEKLDGTLAIVYYDPLASEWCMATRSVPDADLPFVSLAGEMTYRQLFDTALRNTTGLADLPEFMYDVNTDLTFCFELTSPWNRIVVDYRTEALTFLGCRNRLTGEELTYLQVLETIPKDLIRYFPPAAKCFPISTLEQITHLNDTTPPPRVRASLSWTLTSVVSKLRALPGLLLTASRVRPVIPVASWSLSCWGARTTSFPLCRRA